MIKIKTRKNFLIFFIIIILFISIFLLFYKNFLFAFNKLNILIYTKINNIDLTDELKKNESLLGTTDVTGEGLQITIEDGSDLIHQEDLIIILDELKNAGSEAISVNDQRITNFSYIYCDGSVILIDNKKIGSPFIIKAIGNSEVLYSAINRNKGYMQILNNAGIKSTIEKSNKLEISKSNKEIFDEYKSSNNILNKFIISNELIGTSDSYGSGITITINPNSNNHDITAIKLLQLLNDLKCAGANSISINKNRILNMTDIMDINKTYVLVDSNCLNSPYIIKAIGNINDLTASMNLKNSTISKLKSLNFDVSIKSNSFMRINGYNNSSQRGQSKLLVDYIK